MRLDTGKWQLRNVDGQPVWRWGTDAMIDDADFDKLLEYEFPNGGTLNGKPYVVRPGHWHERLYVDRDGWAYIYGGIRHVTLLHGNRFRGMAWEAINGNRADMRCGNMALIEHTNNSTFPGVYFDGMSYWGAVNGRRVGKGFECAEDAYRWAQESWLPDTPWGREWALDNMHYFDEQAEMYDSV